MVADLFLRGNSAKDGELFDFADDAADAILREINPTSISENREYSGRICKTRQSNKFFYTDPKPGREASARPGFCPALSKGHGYYHTHGALGPDDTPGTSYSELVSDEDILLLDLYPVKVGYLATPSGLIKRFTPENLRYYVTGEEDGEVIGTGAN